MRGLLRVLAVGLMVVAGVSAVVLFAYPTAVPRVLGTGGFVSKAARDVPHPFTFDRPRFWIDDTDDLRRSGDKWQVLLLGHAADDGVILANLYVRLLPTASRYAEYPVPAGPYTSLDDFARRHLPREYSVSSERQVTVDGRAAREVTYRYVAYSAGPDVPPKTENSRGRAVFFEDRGYYYMLSYRAGDALFDRYAEVFERAVSTFRFVD